MPQASSRRYSRIWALAFNAEAKRAEEPLRAVYNCAALEEMIQTTFTAMTVDDFLARAALLR